MVLGQRASHEILDDLSWAVLGVHAMGKVDGGTEKADGKNGRKG